MSRTLFRSVCVQYLRTFVALFIAVVAVFLVADFVDRAKAYTGPNWVADVAVLYGYKSLVVAHQLAPAALLLAAGATVSALRKRGELTALKALGFPPATLLVPVGVCALGISLLLVAFDEWVVVDAARRVEEITVHRFKRWGDWSFYFEPKRWFRRGGHVFLLRAGDAQHGFSAATVLTLTDDFTLVRRLDAERMEPLEGTRWQLRGVVERRFDAEGGSVEMKRAEGVYELGADASAFHIELGRPEQMRLAQLLEQQEARRKVGLTARQFTLAAHRRFAYPLAGLPAALLAVLLAMRPGRQGHLTTAIAEGLAIVLSLWALMVVCRALVLTDRMGPPVAAWLPAVLLLGGAAVLYLRREGRLGGGAG